jgi:hypothetical protein
MGFPSHVREYKWFMAAVVTLNYLARMMLCDFPPFRI